MSYPKGFSEAMGHFFTALKKLDPSIEQKEHSADAEAPVKEAEVKEPEAKTEVAAKAEAPAIVDEKQEDGQITALKSAVADLRKELEDVRKNQNSTVEGATKLAEKLAVILAAPPQGMVKATNSTRPTKTEDFAGWNEMINDNLKKLQTNPIN